MGIWPMQSYYCGAQLLSDFENYLHISFGNRKTEEKELFPTIFAQMYNLLAKVIIVLSDHPSVVAKT